MSWPVPGVWDNHVCVRLALPGQRVSALLPLEASEFVLGLAPPIALGMAKGGAAGGVAGGAAGGAAMLETVSSRVTLNTPQGGGAAPTAAAIEAAAVPAAVSAAAAAAAAAAAVEAAPTELLDLRGKLLGGMHAVDPLRFLDLRLGAHLL